MIKRLFFIFLYVKATALQAQTTQTAPPGIVRSLAVFKNQIAIDPKLNMKSLKKQIPNIQLDLQYASPLNFTGVRMYPVKTETTFMREDACNALASVAASL